MTEVPVSRTALMVVDMQNAFIDPAGSMAKIGMDITGLKSAEAGCIRLVEMAHQACLPVIFTRFAYQPGYLDGGIVPNELIPEMRESQALLSGTWDIEIIDSLDVRPSDLVIDKARPSSFYGTRLEPILTSLDVKSLVVCGVTTNICVESTARDAGQRDYRTYVVSDATGDMNPERHRHALETIGFAFGWVVTVADAAAAWSRDDAARRFQPPLAHS